MKSVLVPSHVRHLPADESAESAPPATASLPPITRTFTAPVGIRTEKSDISPVGRILASLPEYPAEEQRVPDALAELAELIGLRTTNVIELPNIGASVNQLRTAIAELQSKRRNRDGKPERCPRACSSPAGGLPVQGQRDYTDFDSPYIQLFS